MNFTTQSCAVVSNISICCAVQCSLCRRLLLSCYRRELLGWMNAQAERDHEGQDPGWHAYKTVISFTEKIWWLIYVLLYGVAIMGETWYFTKRRVMLMTSRFSSINQSQLLNKIRVYFNNKIKIHYIVANSFNEK